MTIPNTDKDVEKLDYSYIAVGNVKCYSYSVKIWQVYSFSNTICCNDYPSLIKLLGIFIEKSVDYTGMGLFLYLLFCSINLYGYIIANDILSYLKFRVKFEIQLYSFLQVCSSFERLFFIFLG